jgi:hypothetical protein
LLGLWIWALLTMFGALAYANGGAPKAGTNTSSCPRFGPLWAFFTAGRSCCHRAAIAAVAWRRRYLASSAGYRRHHLSGWDPIHFHHGTAVVHRSCLTWLNITGLGSARVQNVFTILKVAAIVAPIGGAIATAKGLCQFPPVASVASARGVKMGCRLGGGHEQGPLRV